MAEFIRTEDHTTADFDRATDFPGHTVTPAPIDGDRFETATLRNVQSDRAGLRDNWESDAIPTAATPDRYGQDMNAAAPLLSESEVGELRSRWGNIQAEFVDEPRRSVQQADQLVASAVQRLTEGFANERASLEQQWDRGDSVSTEDLRLALQRYRTFFGRLLNAA
jgi:hypothetical protein